MKWNKYNWQQERNFVFTESHIYNFKKKTLRRAIEILNLAGFTKNLASKSDEFVIHISNEPDYRLLSDQ